MHSEFKGKYSKQQAVTYHSDGKQETLGTVLLGTSSQVLVCFRKKRDGTSPLLSTPSTTTCGQGQLINELINSSWDEDPTRLFGRLCVRKQNWTPGKTPEGAETPGWLPARLKPRSLARTSSLGKQRYGNIKVQQLKK